MIAKVRNLNKQFSSTHSTKFQNLLVNGCSFTWNNSERDICSWPYYLRDLCGFETVLDCSQSGGGPNHIFNSTVNEIETNATINNQNTLIIIMWSGLTRTDVVATQDITAPWHDMSNYQFNDRFATLSLFRRPDFRADKSPTLGALCRQYKSQVDEEAQIYESMIKILALESYLKQKRYNYIFTSWKDPMPKLERVNSALADRVFDSLNNLVYLDQYAHENNQQIPDGHPSPDGYLSWTRACLIPYLESKNIVSRI